MSFLNSFDISASGLSAQRVRMDIAAENIANVDTPKDDTEGFTQSPDESEEDEEFISNPGIDAEDLQELLDTDPSLDE